MLKIHVDFTRNSVVGFTCNFVSKINSRSYNMASRLVWISYNERRIKELNDVYLAPPCTVRGRVKRYSSCRLCSVYHRKHNNIGFKYL